MTMVAEIGSITESRPKPTSAMEAAISPAVIATAASAAIQVRVAYSSRKPRRRRPAVSAVGKLSGNSLPDPAGRPPGWPARYFRTPSGRGAGYPLMPWATCPWCADSCSAWSSSALRCGLMSKTTFLTVPVNANGALSA